MKQLKSYVGLLLLVIFSLMAFNTVNQNDKNNGAIGDVKYSILDAAKFNDENGPGWILMNGGNTPEVNDLFNSSELHQRLQVPSLPDARGVFIRGMNKERDTATGDADGDRNVGASQRDDFQKHVHDIFYYSKVHWDFESNEYAGAVKPWSYPTPQGVLKGKPTGETGGNETRPRNIALYVYIKIN